MKSFWNVSDAESWEAAAGPELADRELALRVYTSRLLGKEPDLVLHGGGNTSVKVVRDDRAVMHVKGSGWDLATIEAPGLPAVWLDPLIEARQAETMRDEDMVALLRAALLDESSPTPSVEALLHAYLPAKVVDHTHSAACLAIADQADGAERCREIFGNELCVVPYVMPGFQLSREADRIFRTYGEGTRGLFLVQHGLFSFGDDAKTSYERIIRFTTMCEAYLEARGAALAPQEEATAADDPTGHPAVAALHRVLSGTDRFSGGLHLDLRCSRAITTYLELPDLDDVACRGTATPDHVIRIKPRPVIGEAGFGTGDWQKAVEDFAAWYVAYFERHASRAHEPKTMLDPLPRVALIRGLGLVGIGTSGKEARIAADLAEQTARIVPSAEAIGRFEPLCEAELFEMEYWSLEQAKLTRG
ncbi:class II aldolase [Halovulum dunhuangense]|uniref:Class II aldolase n=2 Tax=Halovulum dunhuangense TaxID=1505036 RepID=A0A849L0T9_9RHOB|nr:class II aldolase/adducin family protein [Halovulum dunhuangense]NNU79887.1 class II aldolase [Halovulum dunhuangense]